MISPLLCLATAIYFEARDQSLEGQAAVAQVILERRASSSYPSTICGVITAGGEVRHKCAFSFYCDGKSDRPKNERAFFVARSLAWSALNGHIKDATGYATHYHASYVQPAWAVTLVPTRVIGDHIFYRGKDELQWSGWD
jgi:spore germination cell wall hydrolase CwlJ-like protein